jgi:DNA-binding winged helix-turn-helix (wHTH) protein
MTENMKTSGSGTRMVSERYAIFGEWILDTRIRELRRGRKALRLTPKAIDLLERLARSAPEVVTKEEILVELWPETYVCEANIPNLVAEIRTALSDNAQKTRLIRTVHGTGYAFCGTIQWLEEEPDGGSQLVCWVVLEKRDLELKPGDNIVGRGEGCRVFIPSSTVSRQHACIQVGARQAIIRDLESRNGTYVNGRRVNDLVLLSDDDELRFGDVAIVFHTCDRKGETLPVE